LAPNTDTTAPIQEKSQSFLSKIVAGFAKTVQSDAVEISESGKTTGLN
jgi:hypothetical protein